MQAFQLGVRQVRRNELTFTPDGGTLVVGALPHALLDLATGGLRTLDRLGLGSWGWTLVRNGTAVAHIPVSSEVQVYEIATAKVSRHPVERGDARGIAADRGGDTLYLSVGDPNFRAGSAIRVVRASDMAALSEFGRVDDFLGKLQLSADETALAASGGNWNASLRGDNFSFRVWNIAGGNRPVRARAQIRPRSPVNSFALARDGSVLAVAESSALTLWDATGGEQVAHSGKHRRSVTAVACSPTQPVLASGDSAGQVFLWDHAGRILARYGWKMAEVCGLCFAPDGLRCAAVDSGGKVVVWDVDA